LVKQKEKITHLIQVSQTIQDEKTKKRELRALVKASAELRYTQERKLWLITMDESSMETIDGVEIEILNVLEWLLFDGE
jgi:predicted AAA+ superfamily ATPase